MKKITLALILLTVVLTTSVNAQDKVSTLITNSNNEEYKPVAGSSSLELSFDPAAIFSTGGDQFGLQNGMIKYRKFNSELSVFRMSAEFSFGTSVEITDQNDELKDHQSYFSVTFKPGIEKHFKGTERLSPYVGMEGVLGYATQSIKSEYSTDDYEKSSKSDLILGANLLAGVDYYIAKSLYLGVELGYGAYFIDHLKTKYTDLGNSKNDDEKKNGYELGLRSSVIGNFRIGWNF